MISTYQKFMRLLQLEIESLHDEIEIVLRSLDQRHANREITEYVWNENCAVLRRELMCLEDFLRSEVSGSDAEDTTVAEIVTEVESYLRRRMAERDYVPALYELVKRRIEKIAAYLSISTPVR